MEVKGYRIFLQNRQSILLGQDSMKIVPVIMEEIEAIQTGQKDKGSISLQGFKVN